MSADQSQHAQQVHPGWYPNQYGQLQWWDGYQWGTLAPQAPLAASTPTAGGIGFAVTSLVAGIFAMIPAGFSLIGAPTFLLLFLAFVPIVLGVIFGCLGIWRVKQTGAGRQMATTGLVLSLFAFGMPILLAISRM